MNYYHQARLASQIVGSHPGLICLQDACLHAQKILDVGCGEGTRLNTFLSPSQKGWGIDSSPQAITLAKSAYPRHHFAIANAQKLPFSSNSFDLVYSAFAIEHCSDPEKFLLEMIRVCKINGYLYLLCPNYGAPNRRSPVSVLNPWSKLFKGFINDFNPSNSSLNWTKVTPLDTYSFIDADTTYEPYLYTLIKYLSIQKIKSLQKSSLWQIEPLSANPRKFLIRLLGRLSIFPYKYWGPQVFYAGLKTI